MKTQSLMLTFILVFAFDISYSQNPNSRIQRIEECEFVPASRISIAGCLAEGYDWLSLAGDGVDVCTSSTLVTQGDGKLLVKSTIVTTGHIVGKNGNSIPFRIDHKVQTVINTNNNMVKSVITGGGSYGGGLQLSAYALVTIEKDGTIIVDNYNFELHCNN